MSKETLSPGQLDFIDNVASLLVPWDMPQTAARIYGYTMLCREPASLSRIATDLHLSKSSASVAARLLEKHGLVRRHGERGSKRVLYGFSDDYAGLLAEKCRFLGSMGAVLEEGAATVATGEITGRLQDLSRFYQAMEKVLNNALREYNPEGVSFTR